MPKTRTPLIHPDLYRHLIEQAVDGILALNRAGAVSYANKAAARILGTTAKKILDQPFAGFLTSDSAREMKTALKRVHKEKRIVHDELFLQGKRGKPVPIEITLAPLIKDNKIVRVHVSIRTILERKKKTRLEREAEKIQLLHNFIAGTTGEIQYPLKGVLSKIKNLVKTIKARDFEYIGYKEFMQMIAELESMRDQMQYCVDTTDRLMSLTRKQVKGIHQTCDVNQAINEAVAGLKSYLTTAGVKIEMRLSSRLPRADIGAFELNQVLKNILTNAIQAVAIHGKIAVKSSYLKEEQKIRILIKDNGVGIVAADLRRIFDPFFSTKHRGLEKSSGLGLSIVLSILKSHKGDIAVHSSIKYGTEVRILLPVKS